MNKLKSRTIANAIALFLMFAMTLSFVALPAANAQEGTRVTYAFIGSTPNPIGVGQETLLHVGITHELGGAQYGWEGLTVTVTRPDGHTETLGPFRTDATGGTGTIYVPTMAGNYTLQTHFPEQEMPVSSRGTPAGTTMLASESDKLTLVVQEEPIPYYPEHSLPTEYWTRPINSQLREWSAVAGSWLRYHRYSAPLVPGNDQAPDTGHILWAKPFDMGGLAGEEMGDHSFGVGDAYEGKFAGSIIMYGRLYYQAGGSRGLLPVVYHCVDLHTGEELWAKTFLDNQTIAFGQLFYWDSYNMHAVFPYLWVETGGRGQPTIWNAFDAYTGDWRFTVTDIPSGTTLSGSKGEIYKLQIDLNNGWMALWNMSALCSWEGSWGNSVHMRTFNASDDSSAAERAWSWNATIPTDLPGSVQQVTALPVRRIEGWGPPIGDRVIGADVSVTEVTIWGLSLEPGKEGQLLFKNTWNAPVSWSSGNVSVGWEIASLEDRIGVLWSKEERQYYGFSLETGKYLWKTDPEPYLNIYASSRSAIGYGKLFSVGYSGIAHCYDLTTGELLWKYEAYDALNEILWSNNWPLYMAFITDGKIYLHSAEHSPVDPRPRGAPTICLDVETGELVFEMNLRGNHWGESPIIGDSIMAQYNSYDQRIYAIGKGPSATTVTAPDVGVALGKSVLVQGLVTDISPGTEEYALTARFPHGVPAVSDGNMSEWMQYVYMQFERPADMIGVEVVVSVLDPNNNAYEVGRTTSDASGMFSVAFTPEVPGKYIIIASFEGSGAYYGSFAEAAINVEEAPVATPEPTPTPGSASDLYLVPGIVGIIVAIAVVGAILMLMLRKR
jgi:outer membrane protein assembly factor BamB